MKKFVAILSNKQKAKFSDALLMAHVEHLKTLQSKGILELCGPFTDNASAIQIVLSENLETARNTIMADPFIRHGYYENISIKELIQATPENNWLVEDSQTKANKKATQG